MNRKKNAARSISFEWIDSQQGGHLLQGVERTSERFLGQSSWASKHVISKIWIALGVLVPAGFSITINYQHIKHDQNMLDQRMRLRLPAFFWKHSSLSRVSRDASPRLTREQSLVIFQTAVHSSRIDLAVVVAPSSSIPSDSCFLLDLQSCFVSVNLGHSGVRTTRKLGTNEPRLCIFTVQIRCQELLS